MSTTIELQLGPRLGSPFQDTMPRGVTAQERYASSCRVASSFDPAFEPWLTEGGTRSSSFPGTCQVLFELRLLDAIGRERWPNQKRELLLQLETHRLLQPRFSQDRLPHRETLSPFHQRHRSIEASPPPTKQRCCELSEYLEHEQTSVAPSPDRYAIASQVASM